MKREPKFSFGGVTSNKVKGRGKMGEDEERRAEPVQKLAIV
jgi:hypothetical protein